LSPEAEERPEDRIACTQSLSYVSNPPLQDCSYQRVSPLFLHYLYPVSTSGSKLHTERSVIELRLSWPEGEHGIRPRSVFPSYLFGFSPAVRNPRIALLTKSGFSESRKCEAPGTMHSCAPLIDLNSSRVCSMGIESLSPVITIVGALIFPSSSIAILGSLSHNLFVFSSTVVKCSGPSGEISS